MKLGQFSRVPYELKTKDLYSPKVRSRAALTPASAAEFIAAQDIQSLLSPYHREEPEEKKSPSRPPERLSKDSSSDQPIAPQDFKARAREALLDQVNFLEPEYSYSFDLAPSASFFKFLCVRPGAKGNIQKLKMWVPDTVVYNDTDRPFWLYSNLNGEVCRFEGFTEMEVFDKLPSAALDPSVLLKKPCYDHRRKRLAGNTTALVPTEQLKDKVRMLTRGDGEKAVLQRYILNHGSQRFICRTVYQHNKMPYAWLITATHANAVITDNTANIVRVTSGKFLRDTADLVLRLVKYLEMHVKVTFEMLACDFVKDAGGLWWLINVKAFKIEGEEVPAIHLFVQKGVIDDQKDQGNENPQLKEYTRQKRCEFCHVGFEALSHELTLKMIFEMEEHLRKRGKIVSWLENKEYRHIDEATLYQNYLVCDYCFKLYTETQVLKHIESELAKAFGIPKKSDEAPVQDLELEVGIPLRVIKDDPTSHSNFSSLSKFRFLLVFNEVQNADFSRDTNYALEYDFLGKTHRVKVPSGRGNLVLSRLRLFYIFSNGRGKFNLFLKRTARIDVKLMEDGKELSRVKLVLSDFKSPFVLAKYYCEHFGDRDSPILTAHVGIVGEPAEKISDLTLRAFHEVYLPPEDYITCDPLPEEWLPVLPTLLPQLSLSQSLRTLPSLQPLSPKPDSTPAHPSLKLRRRSSRTQSSHPLFQQRYGEITALLTSPSSDIPLSKDLIRPSISPKAQYPNCEDYTLSLHVISANNIQGAEGFEVWRVQWTVFESSKVVERKVEYGLNSAWIGVNEQVKIGLRAQETALEKFLSLSYIDFRAMKVSSSVASSCRLSLYQLLEEKYLEVELPLKLGEQQVASLTVTVSIVKEVQLVGRVVKTLFPGVFRLKLVSTPV